MSLRYLDVRQVAEIFRYKSVATVWRNVKKVPGFPAPIKIGPNSTRWLEHEVAEFITRQVAAARSAVVDETRALL